METQCDFFISYNKADRHWAEWIAWQLEEAGYSTRIQIWDFGAGSNFALEMQRAATEATRTVAVLSTNFLKSEFCAPEWTAAFVQDPTGKNRKLIPVRVRECKSPGMLASIDTIDLIGKEEDAARDELISRIQKSLQIAEGKRAKPDSAPGFPGSKVAAELSKPRFPGTLPPIWRVPFNRNPNFTGREEELTILREQLASGSPAALTQAISGLGGVGKTQLALEYTYRHAADYELVWWIRSEEPATLASDYADLAKSLGLPQAELAEQELKVKAVRQKLGQMTDWLLVFDNAGDPKDLKSYRPQGNTGHIIITSRNDVWQAIAQKLPVKTFNREESIKFIIERTGQDEKKAANLLADELGDLPLALEQAGAYMEATGRSLSGYLDVFRSRRNDLLKSQPAPVDYPETILTTWNISMQQVENESPEAISLLNLFSFLAPDDIPRMLLVQGNDRLPDPIVQVIGDPLLQDEAVRSLKRYSLIELSGDAFSVHRLVQVVVREGLSADQQEFFCNAAVKLVSASMPPDAAYPRSWPVCGRLAPHAFAVCAIAEDLKIANEAIAGILNDFGGYFICIAEYHNAKPVLEQALAIRRTVLGEGHPDTAQSLNNLGCLMQAMGDFTAARPFFEQAFYINRKTLGEENPRTASTLNNLGFVLRAMGDYKAARPYHEQALEIRRRVLGEEHPETATSLNNLGYLLQAMGDYEAARPCYEQAYGIYLKVLGKEHPNTMLSLNNLGSILESVGDYEAARPYYEQALEIRRNALGEEHPDTAQSLNNLGFVLQAVGDYEAARPYYEQALEIRRNALGEEHPDTAQSLNNFGMLLHAMGDFKAARPLLVKALEFRRKMLGEEHPDTALSLNNMGFLLDTVGDYEEALPYYERALEVYRKVLGEEHPHTVRCNDNLGFLLFKMGNHEAARSYLVLNRPNKKCLESNLNFLSAEKKSKRKIGRNEPCPCGSGKKFKKCCGR